MITAGIIVEYNPFHNGHKYHIEMTRKKTGADHIIAVMSGSFVQRGAPAMTDKYVRTQMALSGGADLVLELPILFSTGSAGDFSAGAISLFDKLGVVDHLCFGSECGDITAFERAAAVLNDESPSFSALLQESLRQGFSFPHARAAALKACMDGVPALPDTLLTAPNNILGLEYCSVLSRRKSAIRPVTICREDSGYHETSLSCCKTDGFFASAAALRRAVQASAAPHSPSEAAAAWAQLSPFVPPAHSQLWHDLLSHNAFLFPEDLTKELRYRLLLEAQNGFERYADVSRELSDKLKKDCLCFEDWNTLCEQLKTREITYSRISRALCHILLSITAEDLQAARANDYVPYARILGFRKSAAPLLSAIRKNSSIPLLSKLADAHRLLTPYALQLLQKDITASHLYESAMSVKTGQKPVNEYKRQIILV